MSTADPLLEARAVLLPRVPCAVFNGDPCACYAREGACPHTDPRVTVDHLRAALAEVDRLTRCVADVNPLPEWLVEWWHDWNTGTSSKTIAAVLSGSTHLCQTRQLDAPLDPSDVGRCVRLLDLAEKNGQDWRGRMGEVSAACPAWAPLIPRWAEIETEYREQLAREHAAERARWSKKGGGRRRTPKSAVTQPSRCWWLVSTLRGHGDPYDKVVPHPFSEGSR